MAELTKKLQVKVSGTTTPCKIYSTSAEAGTSYVRAKVDNVEAYIPLVDASDDRASKVHIGSKNIATTGKPPYTEKSWTTAGTYTFTVPAGVTRIRAAVCGGGGGASSSDASSYKTAERGGTSFIKHNNSVLIQATGGGGGTSRYYDGYNRGSGGEAGTPNGRAGTTGILIEIPDTEGFALSFTKTNGTYGSGGGNKRQGVSCSSGGSGGYDTKYLSVISGATLTITVGSGGTKYDLYQNNYPRDGKSGFVFLAYGGDI